MLSSVILSFLLASTALAAPSASQTRRCDLSSAQVDVPAGGALPAATYTVSFLALGVGTQNYTCTSAGSYTNVGAVAELFDVSCLYGTSVLTELPGDAFELWNAAPSLTALDVISFFHEVNPPFVLGEHYFIVNPVTGTGTSPEWDFTSHAFAGNPEAFVVGARVASMSAPTGASDIDWLYLTNATATGTLANEIYRTDTRGGQPPSTCTPGSAPITVKYTAIYWLTGGSFSQ